eukprot:2732991-Prymnesium_polylepis.1
MSDFDVNRNIYKKGDKDREPEPEPKKKEIGDEIGDVRCGPHGARAMIARPVRVPTCVCVAALVRSVAGIQQDGQELQQHVPEQGQEMDQEGRGPQTRLWKRAAAAAVAAEHVVRRAGTGADGCGSRAHERSRRRCRRSGGRRRTTLPPDVRPGVVVHFAPRHVCSCAAGQPAGARAGHPAAAGDGVPGCGRLQGVRRRAWRPRGRRRAPLLGPDYRTRNHP